MKARRGTWHYRLNDYFFGNGYSEGNHNVCPYFWATFLSVGLCWFKWIVERIPHVDLPSLSYEQKERIGRIVFWFIIAGGLIVTIIYGCLISWDDIARVVVVLGIVGAICLGVTFGGIFAKESYDKWRYDHPKKNKPRKEPKPNLLKEKASGWYHRHCPRLEWTDD